MLVLTVSFVGFAAAFFLGSFRGHAKPMVLTDQARIHWVPPQSAASNGIPSVIADYFDPSLMSLPNAHGFSSLMWDRDAETAPRVFVPPIELALLNPTTGIEMAVLLPETSLTNTRRSVVERLPAAADEPLTDETAEVVSVITQSTLRVEGALEQRGLQARPDLPAVKAETDLRPTRVRLAVGPDGRVRYVTLDRSSGSDTVDMQALEVAGQLRFEPASAVDPLALTWGVVKFYWATHN
jgi:TonB family protein